MAGMADRELKLRITVDAQQAQQGVQGVAQAVGDLGAKAQAASTGAAAAADKVGAIGAQAGAINQTEAATGRFAKTTDWLREKWQQTAGTVRDFAVGNVLAQVFMGIAQRATELVRAFIATNEQVTGLRRAFAAIYKDAALAEQQIAFLRQTSNAAGVGFGELSNSFKSFTAAATAANIPLAVQNDLFASVAKAGATLGLTTAETSRAVMALSQMASKGVVSMEELRQQLGESLPGALSLAAKGLGLTEAELIKLVESGGLAARDLFPALAASLKSMAGENDTLTATWERLKNAMAGAFAGMGDSGGMQVLIGGAKLLAGALGIVVTTVQGFTEALFGMARTIGAAAASIAILTDTSTTWAQKSAQLKSVAADLSESFAAAGGRINATSDAFAKAAGSADKAADATGRLKGAADASTAAAAGLSQSWTSIGKELGDAAAKMEQAAANASKHAQAVKSQGAALVELTRLSGDHQAVLQAEQQAAQDNAAALEAVAKAREDQLKILQGELTAKQNLVAGNEAEQKAREQELKTLGDKVAKLTEEARASREAAEAAKTGATARQAAVRALQDQSGQLDALVQKLADERAALAAVKAEYEAGRASREQVTEAERKVALAAANVTDALRDQVDAARAAAVAKKGESDAAIRLLQTQKALAGQAVEMAQLMGNEYAARNARIEQLKIDIKITQAKADAMRAEAEGAIAVAEAQRVLLRASGEVNAVREAELAATIKVAQARMKEADAVRESTKLTERAITNIRLYGSEAANAHGRAASAADAHRSALERLNDEQERGIAAQEKALDLAERAAAVERKKRNIDKQGYALDKDGNRLQQAVPYQNYVLEAAKSQGLSEAAAVQLLNQFFQNGRAIKPGGDASRDWFSAVNRAVSDRVVQETRQRVQGSGANASTGATYVSNITIDGQRTTLNFSDAESQRQAEALLRRLGDDKRRAA